ncbi:glucosaminidase domain-containing protein [Candidatus Saccharibacteria bacterium]|nr:MAG: glucosaminidase domain-containing protein [Candidatus Saccharibacteria bacterium]
MKGTKEDKEACYKFYSDNNILYYDPYAQRCSMGGTNESITAGKITGTQETFVKAYVDAAYAVGPAQGIPWEIILAQGGHESGWGGSKLTTQANNFFGIKASSGWTGQTITMPTKEFVNGTWITVNASFRAYPDAQAGFAGYADFIHSNSRYAPALAYPNNPDEYIRAVAKAGYATDPAYVTSVIRAKEAVIKILGSDYGTKYQKSSDVTPTVTPAVGSTASQPSATDGLSACQCPTSVTNNSTNIGVGEGSLVGNNDAEKAFNFFLSKGISKGGSAGIVGNLMRETGGDTYTLNTRASNGSHWGIVQWDSGRWSNLKNFASSTNADIYSLSVQLAFAWKEMSESSTYRSVIPLLKSALNTPEGAAQAAVDYSRIVEVSGEYSLTGPRATNAQRALVDFQDNEAPGANSTSGSCGSALDSGYKNPYRDVAGLWSMRIDQGIDMGGEGPIYAVGPGVVEVVRKNKAESGWPGTPGSFMTYKLTAGPAAGKSIFFAENCVITVNVGDIVDANTKICDLHGMFTAWSESGWAVNGRTAAKVVGGGYSEGQRTAMGQNFSDFMKSIGGPEGTIGGRPLTGTVPSDYPSWK